MAVDDMIDLPWWQKLVIILGAGAVFYALGISITSVDLPGIGIVDLGLLALPVTVLWVAGMQVSINFMDGADGVAAGVVASSPWWRCWPRSTGSWYPVTSSRAWSS